MIIAIDFDGTCVTHEFPYIGEEIGAPPVLRALVENGHKLILWTCRNREYLTSAIDWFRGHGIDLWSFNCNPEQKTWTNSPKAHAHLLIDDVALGIPLKSSKISNRPYVDWNKVEEMLKQSGTIK